MKNNKGFTLIELLVVVLIIGILAAIALPQYFKAVEKSRAAEANTMLGAINHAQAEYAMSTGVSGDSTTDFDALVINLSCTSVSGTKAVCPWFTYVLSAGSVTAYRNTAEETETTSVGSDGYSLTLTYPSTRCMTQGSNKKGPNMGMDACA